MLDLIFNVIGTPTEDDMSFVTDEKAIKYLMKFKPRNPCNLVQKYPECSADSLRILASMLQFNPYNRPTVDQLIDDPYFDDVRQFSQAYEAPEKISFAFEESE